MYEYQINAMRAGQRQQDYRGQAATERSVVAMRREQGEQSGPTAGRRLMAALVITLEAGRIWLAAR